MVAMRALILDSFGPPPKFGVRDVPSPPLKPGCVRLRIHAVGFGFPDALMMVGKYQSKSEPPFTPGNEIAGVVTEVGAGVTTVRMGDRVAYCGTPGAMRNMRAFPPIGSSRFPRNWISKWRQRRCCRG